MKKTQQDQITKLKKGDRASQLAIYNQYAQEMFNISYRYMQNTEDTEDIIQSSFIKAFSEIKSLKNQDSFGAWLKKIVVNNCLNHLRKNKPVFIELKQLEDYDFELNKHTEPHIDEKKLQQFVSELPKGCRTILQLYLVDNYKHKEIANKLNISVSTSKSQYQRAIQLLRKKCEDFTHE